MAIVVRERLSELLGPFSVPYDESVVPGVSISGVWLGKFGRFQFEVCELISKNEPCTADIRAAWRLRRGRRARPLIVFWQGIDNVLLTEPTGEPQVTVLTVTSTVALAVIQRALSAPRGEAVTAAMDLLERAQGSGGIAGFRNRNLLSTHYVTRGFQRNQATKWAELSEVGSRLRGYRGARLLRALGFTSTGATTFEVLDSGRPRVYATVLQDGTALDQSAFGPGGSPTTRLILEANSLGAERAVIISGALLRIYIADATKGLDDVATASNYIELDLELLSDFWVGLLPLFFEATHHQRNETFDRLLAESIRYAVALRGRFRERVYSDVVGNLAGALYSARGQTFADPSILYGATLRLLYRLLFVLYAEDRNLLPLGNSEYRRVSLTQTLFRLEERRVAGLPFEQQQTTLWNDMFRIFDAIRQGDIELNVPAYNGGLFESSLIGYPDAKFLHAIKVPNAVLAPILLSLGFDEQDGQRGKVDFGDLGVRHLGTLYEGLLSLSVRIAEVPLTVDQDGLYIPANAQDVHVVEEGQIYVTSPKGGRKVSGSHYTPTFVVRRLLDNALEPVLNRHLDEVGKKPLEARWNAMLDFRIVDPAMGSGHFLVDALDVIANRFSKFLADNPGVDADPIKMARQEITAIGKKYGIEALGPTVGDFELLRRIVMRNCLYGVDLNPMAVELAKLSLWLHAFVPGLPLSFLGHNLRHGNALVGVVGSKISEQVRGSLFGGSVSDALSKALEHAKHLTSLSDLSYDEVKKSEGAQSALELVTLPIMNAFDAYSCRMFARNDNLNDPSDRSRGRACLEHLDGLTLVLEGKIEGQEAKQVAQAQKVARRLMAFHWTLAFPEVFLRERPGFDVTLGNPPWEEINVSRLWFYGLYIPGLRSISLPSEQERLIKAYEKLHPDITQMYLDEVKSKEEFRELVRENYILSRSGDSDTYRAFAELSLNLTRQYGSMGMVFPRTLMAADGSAPFRELFFREMSVTADFASNTAGWVFQDVHHSYTVVALSGIRDDGKSLSCAGPATSESSWSELPSQRVTWTYDEIKKASAGFEVPLNADSASSELFHRMVVKNEPFKTAVNGVQFRPWRPIDATNDRKNGLLKERGPKVKGFSVVSGRHFDLWKSPVDDATDFVLDEKLGIAMLQRKRLRSDVWSDFNPKVLHDQHTLPQLSAHVVFRNVTNRTNSRTLIAALLPPKFFSTNAAPLLVQRNGGSLDLALRLAVICSLPFDWLSRRRVELNMNFFILNALPVPMNSPADSLGFRASRLAARLASSDERYQDFARDCGVVFGMLSTEERDDMIAELDAIVFVMYGLNKGDLEVIFRDFTLNAVSDNRRNAVRAKFTEYSSVVPE